MTSARIEDWLHTWNEAPPEQFSRVRLEDDVRESLQSVRVARPNLEQRRRMLELSAKVGVLVTFLGFPAASPQESELCGQLVTHIGDRGLGLEPALMARAIERDLHPIIDIQQRASVRVTADLYLSSSPLRARVEAWSLSQMLGRLQKVARLAAAEGLRLRLAFEDSTRTPSAQLEICVRAALEVGAECIVLNDTAGECLPSGAARHTRTVADLIAASGQDVELAWHGHNDKGLALANSLAAIAAGATLISGTFLGLGERTGNLALEQMVVILAEAGQSRYDQTALLPACELVAAATRTSIPCSQPCVGADAFATSTGTHASALVKARAIGPAFEDAVYSGVSARRLGRSQELLVGPNSSRTGVVALLDALSIEHAEAVCDRVLSYCKNNQETLRTREDVLAVLSAQDTYIEENR